MSWPSPFTPEGFASMSCPDFGSFTLEDFDSMPCYITPEDLFLLSDDNSTQTQEISHIGEQNVVKETVGLDLDKSSNKKQKMLRSDVWNNFEKRTDENGKELAKCNICKKLYDGSSKMGTTHLKNHFNRCSKNKKNEGGGSGSGDKPAENSNQTQEISRIGEQNDDMQFLLQGQGQFSFNATKDSSNQTQEISQIGLQNLSTSQIGLQNDDMLHLLHIFNMGGQGQVQGSFNATEDNSNQTQEISQIGEQNVVKETVGLDLDKSSNKKQKMLRSDVWKNFEKYKDEKGMEWAKCNICKKLYDGSSKMGTTHLKNHFNRCSKNKKNEGGGSGSGDKPAENSIMDPQLNRLDRVKMLIKQCFWSDGPIPKSIEAADIIDVYNEEKEKLRIYFQKLPCRFSLMINIDQSVCKECICFSVYFIDDDWKLKEKTISWKCIGGDPIMKILKNVLSEWGIDNKISYMVLDGYSYEHVLSSNERENGFSSQGSLLFNGKLFCIRDFNYTGGIHSDCIHEIVHDRMKEILKYITGNGNFQIAIDRAKSLGKKVTTEVIHTEQGLEDMDDLLEMGLGLKEAFFELENMDIEFKSINLTKEEWDLITTFYDLIDGTLWYDYQTANMYFPWVCRQYTISLELVKLEPSIYEKERFHSLRDGMKCWYDDNLVVAVAAVLDPRFKMDVVKHWYKKMYGGECETRLAKFMDYLTSVYNEYAKGTNNFQPYEMLDPSGNPHKFYQSPEMLDPSGKPCKHRRLPHTELHLYLEDVKFPLIRYFNILDWWRSNTLYFPTLARMARDFLSIQITIPYCHLYSRIPQPHMHFDSDMVKEEAFVCVRDWLKSEEFE